MANRSSKPYRQNQPNSGAIKHVSRKLPKKPQQKGNWLTSIVAIAILLSSAGLITTFAWISFLFIFNPKQVGWVNKLLPEWAKISLNRGERPQTLKQIQANLSKQGQIAGEILPLESDTTNSFLLPVFKQRSNCQSDCKYIVELRVYQRSFDLELQSASEKYYNQATQLPVTGPEESFVVAPLVDATDDNQGSSIAMPLSQVEPMNGSTLSPGVWFYLRGQQLHGTHAIAYGHIVYYNPERTHLQFMLPWTSPSGQLPQWRQVTSGGAKELVVDQTVGLEPQLHIYQVKPAKFILNPIQLELISLTPAAFKNSAYQNALLIASSGLWTPAFEWLQFIKKQQKGRIPAAAQAQIDVIRLHSQLTKTQADTSWASPSQQVLTDLIDGRWEKALQVFEASPQNVEEIATLLKADKGRLWSRVEAALQVNANRPEVQAWGALILAAKQGQQRANSWLNGQSKTPKATLAYIQSLLGQLNNEVASTKSSPSHPIRIVGSVQSITEVNPANWLQPNLAKTRVSASLQKADNRWYQVQVAAFHNGKSWLYSPFTNLNPSKTSLEKFFWDLGLNSDPEIQIVVWLANGEQQTTTVTIKAVQLRGGVLRLLAAARETIPHVETRNSASLRQPPSLALSVAALEWVQPSPISVEELYRQDLPRVKAIFATVWRSLQKSGQLPDGSLPSHEEMLQKLGHWPVQEIDLTGDQKPETVLTISAEAIASLQADGKKQEDASSQLQQSKSRLPDKNLSRPRTLILSDRGQVIYTDFKSNTHQLLTAIAKLSGQQTLALLVENANEYDLKRWSEKNQRFE